MWPELGPCGSFLQWSWQEILSCFGGQGENPFEEKGMKLNKGKWREIEITETPKNRQRNRDSAPRAPPFIPCACARPVFFEKQKQKTSFGAGPSLHLDAHHHMLLIGISVTSNCGHGTGSFLFSAVAYLFSFSRAPFPEDCSLNHKFLETYSMGSCD